MKTFINLPLELIYYISNESNNSFNLNLTCKSFNSAKLLRKKFFLHNDQLDSEYVISFDINTINMNKLRGLRYFNTFRDLMLPNMYNNLEHLEIPFWNNNFDIFPNLEYLKIDKYVGKLIMPIKLKKFICKSLLCTDIIFSKVLTELDICFTIMTSRNLIFPNTLLHLKLENFSTKYLHLPKNIIFLSLKNFYGKIDFNSNIREIVLDSVNNMRKILHWCSNTITRISIFNFDQYYDLPKMVTHFNCDIHQSILILNLNELKYLKYYSYYIEPNLQICCELSDNLNFNCKHTDYFKFENKICNNTNKIIIKNDIIIIHKKISSFEYWTEDKRSYLSDFYKKYIIMEYIKKEHSFIKTEVHNKRWIESTDFREHSEFLNLRLSEIPYYKTEGDYYKFIRSAYKIPDFDTPEEYGTYVYELDILNLHTELIDGKQYIISKTFNFSKLQKPLEHFSKEQLKESLKNSIFLEKIEELESGFYADKLKKLN